MARLTVAAAGWYTFPDDAVFPYGFSDAKEAKRDWGARMRRRFEAFARIPINVAVGARDCLPDQNTRGGETINAQQGRTRLVRAGNWAKAVERAALRRNVAPDVGFFILPGCGHSFRACVNAGGLDRIVFPPDDALDVAENASPEHMFSRYGNTMPEQRAAGALS